MCLCSRSGGVWPASHIRLGGSRSGRNHLHGVALHKRRVGRNHSQTQSMDSPLHSERRSQLAAGAQRSSLTVAKILHGPYFYLLILASLVQSIAATVRAAQSVGQWRPLLASESVYTAVMACVVLATGLLADVGDGAPPQKGEAGYTRWMLGVHLGLCWPPAFGAYFVWRLAADVVTSQPWLSVSLDAACAGASGAALAFVCKLRPRKAQGTTQASLV